MRCQATRSAGALRVLLASMFMVGACPVPSAQAAHAPDEALEAERALLALLQSGRSATLDDVPRLVRHGANVNLRRPGGVTILMLATRRGEVRLAKRLIDAGADVNASDDNGRTPIFGAVASPPIDRATKLVRLLLRHGADPDRVAQKEWTPLILAATRPKSLPLVVALTRGGARVDTADPQAQTALVHAGDHGDRRVVRFLNRLLVCTHLPAPSRHPAGDR
jgi:ankyrin repeat protein